MYEIRLHGLGGEGVVRLSEMIGMAAMEEGRWAHSFPFYGTEVRGAAVKAFSRVDDQAITVRSYIYEPDVIVLLNDTLLNLPDVRSGIKPDTIFLVNRECDSQALAAELGCKVIAIGATSLAQKMLGRPITNTVMFGALVAATSLLKMETVEKVIRDNFPPAIAEKNVEAARKGYQLAKEANE